MAIYFPIIHRALVEFTEDLWSIHWTAIDQVHSGQCQYRKSSRVVNEEDMYTMSIYPTTVPDWEIRRPFLASSEIARD
jgi:hypothetical protein